MVDLLMRVPHHPGLEHRCVEIASLCSDQENIIIPAGDGYVLALE